MVLRPSDCATRSAVPSRNARSLSGGDVGEALGGDEEGLLRDVGGGVGGEPAAAHRAPDHGVVGHEHSFQAGALTLGPQRARRSARSPRPESEPAAIAPACPTPLCLGQWWFDHGKRTPIPRLADKRDGRRPVEDRGREGKGIADQ